MRLPPLLLGLLAASTLAQTPAAAPAPAPAEPPKAAPSRAIVVGQWLARDGDRWEFTAGGAFIFTPEPGKAAEAKVQRGTYTLTADRKLKLLAEGREPQIVEYERAGSNLVLRFPEMALALVNTHDARAMATWALEDLRLLDAATDQWAIEHNKREGDLPTFADLRVYFKKGTRLHHTFGDPTGPKDVLGHPFSPCIVDQPPKVHPSTFKALSKAAPRKFWEPFID